MKPLRLLCVLTVLSCASPAKRAAPPTEATRPDVIGSWQATGVGFAEISFEADGSFASHLHARPFSSGTWKLIKNGDHYDLQLRSPAGNQTLRAVRRDNDSLHLELDAKAVVWRRISGK